jgi:hypothetical protein
VNPFFIAGVSGTALPLLGTTLPLPATATALPFSLPSNAFTLPAAALPLHCTARASLPKMEVRDTRPIFYSSFFTFCLFRAAKYNIQVLLTNAGSHPGTSGSWLSFLWPIPGREKLLPGKTPVGKILSQISGQYFSSLFKDWDRIFPGHSKNC